MFFNGYSQAHMTIDPCLRKLPVSACFSEFEHGYLLYRPNCYSRGKRNFTESLQFVVSSQLASRIHVPTKDWNYLYWYRPCLGIKRQNLLLWNWRRSSNRWCLFLRRRERFDIELY